MPIRARSTFLLDLDGTLVDPARGILGCCRHALAALGIEAPDDLRWVIGPPIRETFARLTQGRGDPETAVRLYRERYAEWGLTQAEVYPGVREALLELRRRGTRLILCTAKAHAFARRVADHFQLSPLLDGLYGPELDGRHEDNGDLIGHLLAAEALDAAEVCMVGDREHDVAAAARHGVPTIGVLWGYGARDELERAGAAMLITAPHDLLPPVAPPRVAPAHG